MTQFFKKTNQRGMATLEILIAMTLIVLVISAVLPLASGAQSMSVSSQTNQEALYKARNLLEEARGEAQNDFSSIVTSPIETDSENFYQWQTIVDPDSITQCGKDVTGKVDWSISDLNLFVELKTHLGDRNSAVALGGNCDDNPPDPDGWNPPDTWTAFNFNGAQPTSLDVLNGFVYMGGDGNPATAENFYIANTNNLDQNTGAFISFANGFRDEERLRDVKVAKLPDGHTYAFVARDVSESTVENQFEIIDVTDIENPESIATLPLTDVDITGSEPHGWRLFYYEGKVYVVTRETLGPEFHVFDVSNPQNPFEIGGGAELNRTVESLVVTKKIISGVDHYFIYMATKNSTPLSIFEVDPSTGSLTELTLAEPTFTNYQDGRAVFLVGNRLYFGRDSDPSGPELFVYDVSNPLSGSSLPLLAETDVGTSVMGISVSGYFAFLITTQANAEFKVWHSDPSNFTQISELNFPNNVISNGIKYANEWVYTANEGNDALRILYDNLP